MFKGTKEIQIIINTQKGEGSSIFDPHFWAPIVGSAAANEIAGQLSKQNEEKINSVISDPKNALNEASANIGRIKGDAHDKYLNLTQKKVAYDEKISTQVTNSSVSRETMRELEAKSLLVETELKAHEQYMAKLNEKANLASNQITEMVSIFNGLRKHQADSVVEHFDVQLQLATRIRLTSPLDAAGYANILHQMKKQNNAVLLDEQQSTEQSVEGSFALGGNSIE